jgi:hypothetical protein
MSFDKILGPATIIYLLSATVAALWWASDLTRRVTTVEASTVTAERIARLEAEVRGLGENTKELKSSVQDLVRELRNE